MRHYTAGYDRTEMRHYTASCENTWWWALHSALWKHYQLTCNVDVRDISKARIHHDGDGWAWEIHYTYDPQPER